MNFQLIFIFNFIFISNFCDRYYHGHYIIWQGVSFPDGMIVLDGPFPGFNTDPMVWRDCEIRQELEEIMISRILEDPPRRCLKLYADKIYNTSAFI